MPSDVSGLIDMTKAPVGNDGFLLEVHPKLRPVESAIPGLLLAGTAQAPMDISESTSAASAAVAKVTTLLAKDHVEMEPFVARVDPSRCDGCGLCLEACQYAGAIARSRRSTCKAGRSRSTGPWSRPSRPNPLRLEPSR
jgi:heterodisulfide reductase subunit A